VWIGRVNDAGAGSSRGPAERDSAEGHAEVEWPPGQRLGPDAAILERGQRLARQADGPDAFLPLRRPLNDGLDQASYVAAYASRFVIACRGSCVE
jgi:hypothetical protein